MTAQELKNSILQLAIQGKLVKQNPNDEPASVLLEKIKEEREKLIKEKKIKREKYSEIYKDSSDNHYYEKFEDGTINDITEEIPFEIPDSWRWIRHNQLFEIVGGSQPPKSEFSDIQQENYVRLYQIRDYGKNPVPVYVEKSKVSKFSQKGDIILARYGGSLGKVFWAEDGAYNVALAKVCKNYKSNDLIYDKFLFMYYLSSIYQLFVKSASRSAQAGFNKDDLNALLFPLPPYNEQIKIIDRLEDFYPYIEQYELKYTELNKLNSVYKEELKKSILQYAIQGKLVRQNSNDEPAEVLINKILEEKRELIKTKQIKKENLSVIYKEDTDNQFYEKFDDGTIVNITDEIPFDIPSNWCWARMKNICLINPRNSLDDNLETSFIPMTLIDAGYSNSHTYEIKKWKEIKSGFTHFKENDIGLAKITPCFQNRKSTIFSNLKNGFGAGTTELHILRPINDLIYTKFIFWLIKSPYFIDNGVKTYSGTAGQQRINKDFLPNFLVPIPNYKTQVCIINKIETIFNLI